MKPGFFITFFLLLAFMAAPLAAQEAKPAPAPVAAALPVPLLVVDMKRVLDESRAAVSVQKKIEAKRDEFQKEIADRENSIRTEGQELLQSRTKMDAKAYAEKENQLRQKFGEVERYVQERRRVLEQATNNSMGRVRSVLQSILTDIAHKRSAQVVLSKQQVLWSEPTLEVTDQVLERLNAELPDTEVVIEPARETSKAAKPH